MRRALEDKEERPPKRQRYESTESRWSLVDFIPSDIWRLILDFCPRRTILVIGCVSTTFGALANRIFVEKFQHLCCISDTFLAKFVHLKYVKVETTSNITITGLTQLTNLEALCVKGSHDLLPALTFFTNLNYLKLKQDCHLTKITHLTRLTSLSTLGLHTEPETYDLSRCLPHLKRLRLYRDATPEFLNNVVFWTNLTGLKINVPYKYSYPEDITRLTNLTELAFDYNLTGGMNKVVSVLTNLQSIETCQSLIHSNLTNLPYLNKIALYFFSGPYDFLTQLTGLTHLNCCWSGVPEDIVSHLTNLTKLKNVNRKMGSKLPTGLKYLSSEESLNSISHLTNLTELRAYGISCDGFTTLTNITNLKFSENPDIKAGFTLLTNLTRLESYYHGITNEQINKLPKLKKVSRPYRPTLVANCYDIIERITDFDNVVYNGNRSADEDEVD